MGTENLTNTQDAILSGNVPQIVLSLLSHALDMGASDIHIEPGIFSVRIRFRVDGVLTSIVEYPLNLHAAVVSRIKIQSNLKIDEQRKPQDGRMQMFTEDRREIELRVSTLPTIHTEKIVMRLQNKNQNIPTFDELGIRGINLERMKHMVDSPNGIALVTGPTGSGKTTTLYSTLSKLNTDSINIMTIEDPVEYEMAGLAQSQVRPEIGYDFANGLRSALRQDPDIIMVGEIRDQETIEIAIKAALTGHFVMSTIHTNSAVGTISRLLDMGVKPFKITAAIRTIVAQRLVRRICLHCREEYIPDTKVQHEIRRELENCRSLGFDHALLNEIRLWRGRGCKECGNTGVHGRVGVYEVMEMDRDIEKLILSGVSETTLHDVCTEKGMITLAHAGWLKALDGETTAEEVYRLSAGEY